MERDLTDLLKEWLYEPGKINVRLIQGSDGEPRLQVRVDLGILQMFADGRPDGLTPHGYGSLLEYHEARLDQVEHGGPPEAPPGPYADPSDLEAPPEPEDARQDEQDPPADDPPPPSPDAEPGEPERFLTPDECRELREEALQYYHRYVALLVLEDYDGVIRDTTRNLRVLDICRDFAIEESDREALEQFRAYILMMRARALASQALKDSEPKAAIHAIDEGLDALRGHYAESGRLEELETSREYAALRSMRDALVPKLPVSQRAELRQRLSEALASENYELAAILRDELRMLPEEGA